MSETMNLAPRPIDPAPEVQEDALEFLLRAPTDRDSARAVLEVAKVWGEEILDIQHHGPGAPAITVGEEEGSAFYEPVESLPSPVFPLFRWEDGRWVASVGPDQPGFVERGGLRRSLGSLFASGALPLGPDGLASVPIEGDTLLAVELGTSIYIARLSRQAARAATPWRERLDRPLLATLALLSFVSALFLVVVATTPPALASTTNELPPEYMVLLQRPEPELQVPEVKVEKRADDEGKRAKKEEGKAGKPDAKMKRAKGDRVELRKRELDREAAEDAGLLAAMREGAASDVFGSSALSSDLTKGVGGLIGARGTQIGSGGLGGRGGGLGGGGQAEGIGGLGTNGRGGGMEGYGSESGGIGEKEDRFKARALDPIVIGPIDKSLIDAVIKRNMNQIRYCYQQQLTRDPTLGGKITVKFAIARDGSVSTSETKQSTMGNAAVENCINQRFMKFEFPALKGGDTVIVSYPFLFAPG